eukprot:SAG31_NODE_25192_length_466_cov_0.956403_1_plen_110_part_10
MVEPLLSLIIREADSNAAGPAGAGKSSSGKRGVSALDLLVYAVGALKNISNNAANQKVLSQQGAFAALSSVMQYTVDLATANSAVPAVGSSKLRTALAEGGGLRFSDRQV